MSKVVRVGVLQMPSSRGSAWRVALKAAARRQGWSMVKGADVALDNPPPAESQIILLRDGAQALAMAPALDACVIVTEDLEDICATMAAHYPDKKIKAYAVAAERLAAGITLARRGAYRVQASATEADLPLIGRIQVEASLETVGSTGLGFGPLAMFSDEGPEPGHPTIWPWDLFNYRTTPRSLSKPPHIDLTGRARVLFHGPRFSLPAGEWRVRLRFHLDPEGRESSLKFEWGAAEDFETLELQLDAAGLYEVELSKRWEQPVAAEVRVWAAAAHFLGAFEFVDADVAYLAH